MTTKSKKTVTAEKDLADVQARLAKAQAALDDAFEHDDDGARIPALTATVSLTERRLTTAGKALHAARVADAVAEIADATKAYADARGKCHEGKARHLAETLKLYERKPSIAKRIAGDRKLAPDWLKALRDARHVAHTRMLDAFEALRALDVAEARKRGINRIDDYVPPALPGPVEV